MATEPEDPSLNTASQAQLNEDLGQALSSADTFTIESAQALHSVHQARQTQLARRAANLKQKFGAKDPRVQDAEAAAKAAQAGAGRVFMASQQLSTPAPVVSSGGWALYGRIFHADATPAVGYTVFLVDAQKNYQQQFGFSYTDKSGYFEIDFAGAAVKSQAVVPVYVEIVDTKAQPVFLDTEVFQPTLGSATYKNVTLPADEKPLGDPPPEIRKVAFPGKGKRADT